MQSCISDCRYQAWHLKGFIIIIILKGFIIIERIYYYNYHYITIIIIIHTKAPIHAQLQKLGWYTADRRDVLENTPPEAICTPRPKRLAEGWGLQIHSNSRQCIDILFSRVGVYWKLRPKQPGSTDTVNLTVYKFNSLNSH